MRKSLAFLVLLSSLPLQTSPAAALNADDYAAMMGMLWRLREPICPRLSFDADVFVKRLHLPAADAEQFRKLRRAAFDSGYELAGELKAQSESQFCQTMETMFDGRHAFDGSVKPTPGPPIAGLTIRQ